MNGLALTVPFHEDESLASLCSRLASANGIGKAREFCTHMGMQFQHIVDGHPSAVAKLAALIRQTTADLQGGVIAKVDGRYLINGEKLTRPFLARSRLRYCPTCLKEDASHNDRLPGTRLYGRRNWLVSFIRTCSKHDAPLAATSKPAEPSFMHDFSALMRVEEPPSSREVATESRRYSDFERYVSNRLEGKASSFGLLDSLPLYAAARATEILGAVLEHGIKVVADNLSEDQWWKSANSGFEVISQGEQALRDCLSGFHQRYFRGSGNMGGRSLYGRFYEWLAHESDDPAYEPLRNLLRNHAVASLPFGPGDDLFGPLTVERRWHSVHTAALQYNVHPKRLRKLVVEAGLAEPDALEKTYDRILLDARTVDSFMLTTSGTVSYKEARSHVNAPRVQWKLLVDDGYVRPHANGRAEHGLQLRFTPTELDRFLDELRIRCAKDWDGDPSLVTIPEASRRANCKVSEILELLLAGSLCNVAADSSVHGFLGIRISFEELRSKTMLPDHGGLSLRETERRLGTKTQVLVALLELGAIKSSTATNPINRCPQTIVRPEDLESFNTKFVSLSNLARERGEHFSKTKKTLVAAGILPAFDPGRIGATIYEREQLPE